MSPWSRSGPGLLQRLGMIQEVARSKVPALGYGMPSAVGNTLLTIFGMVIVLMLA